MCRLNINRHIHRVKRAFSWGVENELIPPMVYQALQAVRGLHAGRTEARESAPVLPVAEGTVKAAEHTSCSGRTRWRSTRRRSTAERSASCLPDEKHPLDSAAPADDRR